MTWPGELLPTLVGVFALVVLTTVVLSMARVPHRWAPALAILRGAAQLAAISLVLTGVISNPVWVALALVVMFGVAAATATRRFGWSIRRSRCSATCSCSMTCPRSATTPITPWCRRDCCGSGNRTRFVSICAPRR